MRREEIEERTRSLVLPILDGFKFELWDVEYVKECKDYFLRVYIDKDGGITIDDCVDVSRKLSDMLDEDDFIDGEYTLEVSSPGVERTLKKDNDFERSIGKEVYIKLYKPQAAEDDGSEEKSGGRKNKKAKLAGQKEFIGTLLSFDKDSVTVEIKENKTNISFNRKDIALIRLYVEF